MLSLRWLYQVMPRNVASTFTCYAKQNKFLSNSNLFMQSVDYSSHEDLMSDDNLILLSNNIGSTLKTDSQKKEFLSKFNLSENCYDLLQSIAADSDLNRKNAETLHELKSTLDKKTFGILEEVFSGTCSTRRTRSNFKCLGCGAFLQSHNRLEPGFISSEQMNLPRHILKQSRCKRCFALHSYDLAVGTAIRPEQFKKLIATQIKSNRRSVVVVMIDLTDFTEDTLPDLLDGAIHRNSQVLLVGNKFDLLPPDSVDYDDKIETILRDSASSLGRQLRGVHLISAKTGFGVERLVSSIKEIWRSKRDIYLIGAVNVGKSSLFNLLSDSDLSEPIVLETFQKATISMWPGTTLNTLKFPLLNLSGGKMQARKMNMNRNEFEDQRDHFVEGYVSGSVRRNVTSGLHQLRHGRAYHSPFEIEQPLPSPMLGDDVRWFHDTPGILSEGSILPFLNRDELEAVMPSQPYIPRIFSLSPQEALTFGGLGRLEYITGQHNLMLFIFSSPSIPIVIATMKDTNAQFQTWLSSGKLQVPSSLERHKELGSFQDRDLQFSSDKYSHAVCDVVFASTGWICVVMPEPHDDVCLKASCLHNAPAVRRPLLDRVHRLQGKRMKGTPKYAVRKNYDEIFKHGKYMFERRR